MRTSKISHIEYEKTTDANVGSKGKLTERYIIPTFIPQQNIKAIDVTDLPAEERNTLSDLHAKYVEYYNQAAKTLFSFEDWVEHTTGKKVEPKWRTFRSENVKVLD